MYYLHYYRQHVYYYHKNFDEFSQPWFDNEALAIQLANATAFTLNNSNNSENLYSYAPFYIYRRELFTNFNYNYPKLKMIYIAQSYKYYYKSYVLHDDGTNEILDDYFVVYDISTHRHSAGNATYLYDQHNNHNVNTLSLIHI